MSPRQPRRIIDSSDDESLPETWEEMQRNIEPVSPASEQQEAVHRIWLSDPPRVITIEDDDSPQEPPLGDEAPFEVLLSMVDDAPAPPAEPEPAPRPPEPEPAPRPPELAPAPAPEPEPVHNRSESPQPGPSGIHDDEKYGRIEYGGSISQTN